MTRTISKSGRSRQRIWDALRKARRPLPAREIAVQAKADKVTVWGYLGGLKTAGYASDSEEAGASLEIPARAHLLSMSIPGNSMIGILCRRCREKNWPAHLKQAVFR